MKKNGESFRMFQIILVFWLEIIKIMYLFDIGMFELSMVLSVFDFVYILKRLQFVCVCVCEVFFFLFCPVAQVVEMSGQVAPSCHLWGVCVFPFNNSLLFCCCVCMLLLLKSSFCVWLCFKKNCPHVILCFVTPCGVSVDIL